MDRGVIKAFKSYYVRHTFAGIVDCLEAQGAEEKSITQCWKEYDIADCITNIKTSVDELK